MTKCILKGKSDDDESGYMKEFSTEYSGIPEACAMWASGYKHGFLYDCKLYYENGNEVPEEITDMFYNRYYYGRYIFDQNGEEVGRRSWSFVHIELFIGGYKQPEICPRKCGILMKEKN